MVIIEVVNYFISGMGEQIVFIFQRKILKMILIQELCYIEGQYIYNIEMRVQNKVIRELFLNSNFMV